MQHNQPRYWNNKLMHSWLLEVALGGFRPICNNVIAASLLYMWVAK